MFTLPTGSNTNGTVRVRLEEPTNGGGIQYNDPSPRLGRALDIVTNRYEVSGQIRAVGSGDTLDSV